MTHHPTLSEIVQACCRVCGVSIEDMLADVRHPRTIAARGLIVTVARRHRIDSYPMIAHAMGRKSHSGIIGMHRRMMAQIEGRKTVTLGTNPVELADLAEMAWGEAVRKARRNVA